MSYLKVIQAATPAQFQDAYNNAVDELEKQGFRVHASQEKVTAVAAIGRTDVLLYTGFLYFYKMTGKEKAVDPADTKPFKR